MRGISRSKGLGLVVIVLVLCFFFVSMSPVLRMLYHDAEPYKFTHYSFPATFDPIKLSVKASELPPGKGGSFKVTLDLPFSGPKKVRENIFGLLFNDEGTIKAYSAVCPHLNCAVKYDDSKQEDQQFWCNCHDGAFDPSSGEVTLGPPPKPLSTFVIEVRDDDIYLISIGGGE
ncbi:MAG TPA: Rieske (2Fe-2S) protein [Caldisericia bacterium]|nr:Rieske (2Fe-2S) protein [Caldisericia bacterium]